MNWGFYGVFDWLLALVEEGYYHVAIFLSIFV